MKSYVWQVDDGATHTVIGITKEDALVAWRKVVMDAGEVPAAQRDSRTEN